MVKNEPVEEENKPVEVPEPKVEEPKAPEPVVINDLRNP
jgi:hypothetical protein